MLAIRNPQSAIRNPISRRSWLRMAAAGVSGVCASGWFDVVAERAARAAEQGGKHKSCILLWMAGGPSQAHTFDPKPDKWAGKYGTPKPIATTVPGMDISEYLPKCAQQAKHMSLLRSMSTGDVNHITATHLMRTGFRQNDGGVVRPHLGAVVAKELGQPDADMPNFMFLGMDNFFGLNAGYIGPAYAPVVLADPAKGIPNLKSSDGLAAADRRAELMKNVDAEFARQYQAPAIEAHGVTMQRTMRLMRSDLAVKAFNLDAETAATREAFGKTPFGTNCLIARRLIENGVRFVEVQTPYMWDTHGLGPTGQKSCAEFIDAPVAALIADLHERGLLAETLVIWAGEFGRSFNGDGHYAAAWTTMLAGGGLKTGQAIGKTDDSASTVKERPISVADFSATVLHALGINHAKRYQYEGRNMKLVDNNASVVTQLF